MGSARLSHHYTSDEESVSSDNTVSEKSLCRRRGGRGSQNSQSGSDFDGTSTPQGQWKKKDGFSSKIQIPEFGGKKGHPHDVADAFRQWACCITYYHEYYEDSYLMPLVVSSLTGDTSDVFNWMCSATPGGTQDLSVLLQMLRKHYCGSFTFWEQRNMVENLCQGAREDATDFMIRVGSSVGNLAKDWKGQLTEAELQSLQYEVSLNGVREEIHHVLDSEIARHGQLTPHQMYKVVKRYETYVAHNKCLEGRVLALTLVTRGLLLRLLAINLASTKPLPSPPQMKSQLTLLCLSRDLLFLKMMIIWEGSQPRKRMKDCTSQASWRRL